ncbi:MAG: rhomboid family intramembrane serine protease, partial [Planctomycetota bacterium]
MRQLGTLADGKQARRFVDYMLTEGMTTRTEQDDDGSWLIWIVQEDHLERARSELRAFSENPTNRKYGDRSADANAIRAEKRDRLLTAKKNHHEVRSSWGRGAGVSAQQIPATMGLIVVCVIVALFTQLGGNRAATDPLMFVSRRHLQDAAFEINNPQHATVDVRAGQVWRIVTPAFVHLGVLHIVFNMMWIHMLAGQIEQRKGRVKLLLMVFALAAFSNLFQVFVTRYPFFGGMSGVVYGLFGYVWMK